MIYNLCKLSLERLDNDHGIHINDIDQTIFHPVDTLQNDRFLLVLPRSSEIQIFIKISLVTLVNS